MFKCEVPLCHISLCDQVLWVLPYREIFNVKYLTLAYMLWSALAAIAHLKLVCNYSGTLKNQILVLRDVGQFIFKPKALRVLYKHSE